MTEPNEHPYVAEFLLRFDQAAAALSAPRRMLLREEIAEHLRDAIPPTATDAEAAEAIARFGSPAEILAHELDEADPRVARHPRQRRPRWIGWVIAAAALILVVLLALPFLSILRGAQQPAGTPALSGNPVAQEPDGPARVTTGQGYFEYLAAIESMEHPLPDGAEYPLGVPEGLDAGKTADGAGIMESGGGTNIAHHTWLSAWESEYLAADAAGDDRRLVAAEAMIAGWAESDFYLAMGDSERGWVSNVVVPMRMGDASGVKQDRTQVCAVAGILNVTAG
jgi:hypothetical protein